MPRRAILLIPPVLYVALVAATVIIGFTHPNSIVQWLLFDLTAAPWSQPPRGLPVAIGLLLNLGISIWVGVALADLAIASADDVFGLGAPNRLK